MNEKHRFLHCIGFLLLLATVAQSDKSVTRCAEKRGFCVPKDLCNAGSESLCDEKNEVCCPYDPLSKTKRSPICATTQTCIDNYGYCTIPENCYEKIVPEGCEGESCICCAPVCATTQTCIDNYGYCTIPENCYEKIVPEWCEGESCICCAPVCPSTQQCQEAYGYCSSPDSCYGKYVPEWCDGEDCVCCIQDCFPNPECLNVNGYCTSPDTCSGNIVPEWCGGEMCVCCVPATVTAVAIIEPCETPVDCQSARGYCSQTCPPWLYPDPSLCPDGCYCCLGEYELAPQYH